jgi:hypothetical protein
MDEGKVPSAAVLPPAKKVKMEPPVELNVAINTVIDSAGKNQEIKEKRESKETETANF